MIKKIKKKLKKDLELALFISFLLLLVIYGMYKPTITGYVVYQITEYEKEWYFTNPEEYIYNDSLIQIDGNVQLIPQEQIKGMTFQNGYEYSGTEDTRIYEKYPSYSYSSNPDSPIKTLEEENQRMLIRFNDFIGEDKIPNNANIVSAVLKMYSYDNGDNGLVSVYEMKKNWTEGDGYKAINQEGEYGCTWNKAIDYYDGEDVNWSVEGADGEDDREQTVLDTKIIPEENNWIYFDITSVVQKWVNNEPNYGVIFIADDDEGADNFFGKENSNEQYHPILIINYTHTYYSNSSIIDTQDFTVENFDRWDLLTTDQILNNQNIDYYYSTNSQDWNLITGFNLSYVNSSIIRLRANLTSDSTSSPVLNSLSLKYSTSIACIEDWQLQYSSCTINDTKLKYYTDANNCGSYDDLPEDNNSYVICDYCLPNWVCVDYDSCNMNIKQKECKEVADTNYCYDLTGLDSDNNQPNLDLECTKFITSTITEQDTLNYNFYYNTNATLNINLNNSDLFINIEIINNVTNGSISIINYNNNIKNETINTGLKYFEINSNIDNNNLNSNTIKIYYTDEEINSKNLDENTLKIYYYNETNEWQELNSILNKTGKYLQIILDHLSYYGVFGEEKQTQTSPTSSSGGGGGGGGYILTPEQKEEIIKKKETKNYEIDSSIENEISFIDSNKYRFNIKNKGDKIDKIELYLGNNLVRLTNPVIENFEENADIEILLITDSVLTRNKPNLLIQGLAAKTIEQQIKDVLTEFTILGTVNNEIVANETIQLKLKLLVFDKITNKKTLPYNIIFIIILILLKISLLLIWNFKIKKKKNIKKEINNK